MWLSKAILAAGEQRPSAEIAKMTEDAGASGRSRYASLPLCGPWGVAYKPPAYADAVVVESSLGSACVGAFVADEGLAPGELLLFSSGGASIYLKNSGEIVINGRSFPPVGDS